MINPAGIAAKQGISRSYNCLVISIVICLGWSAALQAETIDQANEALEQLDYERALALFEELAAQGEPQALYQLGVIYEEGLGTEADEAAANGWYQQALEKNSPRALAHFGGKYREGAGVVQNFKESLRLYRLSAELGYAPAQHVLGMALADGMGTFRDPVKAHMWFNLASASGYAAATIARDRLAANMGQSEVTLAQDKALQCAEKNYRSC